MSAPPATSRVLTLVFTDLAGSTALKTERGDEAGGALITRHRSLVATLAQQHGGRVVDFAGDGAFLVFSAPSAGAQFALALQSAHASEPELPRVRVGIHLGEVSERDGRVEGLAVDLAARVQSLAAPEQVLLSAAAATSARQRTPREISGRVVRWRNHGAYTLKGASEPLEVFEAGLEGIAPFVAPRAGEKARPARALPRGALLLSGALLALAAGGTWLLSARSDSAATPATPTALPPIRSIAVLPLANLSGDPEQEFFADGMTETLIAELAKLPGVQVISRTSVMQFKGSKTSLPEIAKQLNVDGVIEGSVMRAESQVRITAQLIDARSDQHLWAEQYDRELARVFEIQSEVARAVAGQIALALTPEQAARLDPPKPVDPRAQEAYFRGMAQLDVENDFASGRHSFETAVELAPDFAPAWAALSYWVSNSCQAGCLDPARVGSEAKAAAERALALDPNLGDAHTAMGVVHQYFDWDWAAAESELRRAAELSSRTDRWSGSAFFILLLQLGRREEARAEYERWSSAFGNTLFALMMRRYFLAHTGEFERAQEESATTVRLHPKSPGAHFDYADALERVGSYEEAARELETALTLLGASTAAEQIAEGWRVGGKDGYLRAREKIAVNAGMWSLAAVACAQRGDIEGAFAHLETAFAKRDPALRQLTIAPRLRPLHSDPRFADLARRMNLPLPKP